MKIKDRQRAAKKLFKLPAGKLEQVDLSSVNFIPNSMTRAYRNNRYTVMVYDDSATTQGLGYLCKGTKTR